LIVGSYDGIGGCIQHGAQSRFAPEQSALGGLDPGEIVQHPLFFPSGFDNLSIGEQVPFSRT
jgi:hypothetical protein